MNQSRKECSCSHQCVQIISADLIFSGIDKVCFNTTHAKSTLGSHRNSWVTAKGNVLQWVLCSPSLTSPPCTAVHRSSSKEGSGVLLLFSMCIYIKLIRKGATMALDKPEHYWPHQSFAGSSFTAISCWLLHCFSHVSSATSHVSSSPPLALLL